MCSRSIPLWSLECRWPSGQYTMTGAQQLHAVFEVFNPRVYSGVASYSTNLLPPKRPLSEYQTSAPHVTNVSSTYSISSSVPPNDNLANEETAVLVPGAVAFLLKKSTSLQPGSAAFSF